MTASNNKGATQRSGILQGPSGTIREVICQKNDVVRAPSLYKKKRSRKRSSQ